MRRAAWLLLTTAALLACSADPHGLQGRIRVELPVVRVEGAGALADVEFVRLLTPSEGYEYPPAGVGEDDGDRPAVLLCAEPDEDAWMTLTYAFAVAVSFFHPRVFLAGRLPDGDLACLPLLDDEWVEKELDYSWQPPPGEEAKGPGFLEVRLTRTGEGVRVRWGHRNADPRWDGGDETLPAERFDSPGAGPILPDLARMMEERFETDHGPHELVRFQAGQGVRVVELVRIFECAQGNREIVFVPVWSLSDIEVVRCEPPVAPPGTEPVLDWDRLPAPVRWLTLGFEVGEGSEGGAREAAFIRGKRVESPDDLSSHLEGLGTIMLRTDAKAAWRTVAAILDATRDAGVTAVAVFVDEDPNFLDRRYLMIPPAAPDADLVEVSLAPTPGGDPDLA